MASRVVVLVEYVGNLRYSVLVQVLEDRHLQDDPVLPSGEQDSERDRDGESCSRAVERAEEGSAGSEVDRAEEVHAVER